MRNYPRGIESRSFESIKYGKGLKVKGWRFSEGVYFSAVCLMPCRKLNLFSDAFVVVDGSEVRAVNNRNRNFIKAKIKKQLQQQTDTVFRPPGQA